MPHFNAWQKRAAVEDSGGVGGGSSGAGSAVKDAAAAGDSMMDVDHLGGSDLPSLEFDLGPPSASPTPGADDGAASEADAAADAPPGGGGWTAPPSAATAHEDHPGAGLSDGDAAAAAALVPVVAAMVAVAPPHAARFTRSMTPLSLSPGKSDPKASDPVSIAGGGVEALTKLPANVAPQPVSASKATKKALTAAAAAAKSRQALPKRVAVVDAPGASVLNAREMRELLNDRSSLIRRPPATAVQAPASHVAAARVAGPSQRRGEIPSSVAWWVGADGRPNLGAASAPTAAARGAGGHASIAEPLALLHRAALGDASAREALASGGFATLGGDMGIHAGGVDGGGGIAPSWAADFSPFQRRRDMAPMPLAAAPPAAAEASRGLPPSLLPNNIPGDNAGSGRGEDVTGVTGVTGVQSDPSQQAASPFSGGRVGPPPTGPGSGSGASLPGPHSAHRNTAPIVSRPAPNVIIDDMDFCVLPHFGGDENEAPSGVNGDEDGGSKRDAALSSPLRKRQRVAAARSPLGGLQAAGQVQGQKAMDWAGAGAGSAARPSSSGGGGGSADGGGGGSGRWSGAGSPLDGGPEVGLGLGSQLKLRQQRALSSLHPSPWGFSPGSGGVGGGGGRPSPSSGGDAFDGGDSGDGSSGHPAAGGSQIASMLTLKAGSVLAKVAAAALSQLPPDLATQVLQLQPSQLTQPEGGAGPGQSAVGHLSQEATQKLSETVVRFGCLTQGNNRLQACRQVAAGKRMLSQAPKAV